LIGDLAITGKGQNGKTLPRGGGNLTNETFFGRGGGNNGERKAQSYWGKAAGKQGIRGTFAWVGLNKNNVDHQDGWGDS